MGGSGAERWGESERDGGRERDGERDPRRQGEAREGAGKLARRPGALQEVPKIQGTRVTMWSQPSNSVFPLLGFKKEEEAAAGRRPRGGWPSQGPSAQLPETPPTHLPRMQQEVEPLCSSTLGSPCVHKEAGTSRAGVVASSGGPGPQRGPEGATGIPK